MDRALWSFSAAEQFPLHRNRAAVVLNGLDGLPGGDAPDDRDFHDIVAQSAPLAHSFNDQRPGAPIAPPEIIFSLQRLQEIEHAGTLDVEGATNLAHGRGHGMLADEGLHPLENLTLAQCQFRCSGSGHDRSSWIRVGNRKRGIQST